MLPYSHSNSKLSLAVTQYTSRNVMGIMWEWELGETPLDLVIHDCRSQTQEFRSEYWLLFMSGNHTPGRAVGRARTASCIALPSLPGYLSGL